MTHLIIRHKVEDFGRWKSIVDDHDGARRANGFGDTQLFQTVDNPNEVVILFEVKDVDLVKQFAVSDGLRNEMKEAGVSDSPDFFSLVSV